MKAKLLSAILSLAATLAVLITCSPLLWVVYQNSINNNPTAGTRVVGVNYPIYPLIVAGAAFLCLLFFMFLWSGKKRERSHLFWINGFSVSIIIPNIIIWLLIFIPN